MQKTKYEKHRLWIDISNKLWQKNIINLIIIIQKIIIIQIIIIINHKEKRNKLCKSF